MNIFDWLIPGLISFLKWLQKECIIAIGIMGVVALTLTLLFLVNTGLGGFDDMPHIEFIRLGMFYNGLAIVGVGLLTIYNIKKE